MFSWCTIEITACLQLRSANVMLQFAIEAEAEASAVWLVYRARPISLAYWKLE